MHEENIAANRVSLSSIPKSGEKFEKSAQCALFTQIVWAKGCSPGLCDGRKNLMPADALWLVIVAYIEARNSPKFQVPSLKTDEMGAH